MHEQANYRVLLDKLADGVVVLRNDIVVHCDAVARSLLASRLPEPLGASAGDLAGALFPGASESAQRDACLVQLSSASAASVSILQTQPDGSMVGQELALTAVIAGNERFAIVLLRDAKTRSQWADRVQALDSLQQTILDSADAALMALDLQGTIRTFNRAAERLTGYAACEMNGRRNLAELLDYDELLAHAMELSAATGETVEPGFGVVAGLFEQGPIDEEEWSLLGPGGERIPVLLSADPIRDADDRVTGYLITANGLFTRKQNEKERQRNDMCMRAAVECTPNVAVQWYDINGRVLFWNDASERFYGWRAADVMARRLDGLSHDPAQWEGFLESLRDLARDGGHVGPFEVTLRRGDGSPIVVVSTLFTIPGDEVAPYFVRMDIDISDRHRAEQAVLQQRNMLQGALEAMPGIVYLIDSQGRLLSWNRNLEQLCGLHGEQLKNADLIEWVHPGDRSRARQKIRSVLRSGRMQVAEVRLIGQRDRVLQVLANGSRVMVDGQPCVVGAAVDISARKLAERELAQSKRTLLERNESLRVINQLSSRLHDRLDTEAIVHSTREALGGYSRVHVFGIFLFDQSRRHLSLAASSGFDDQLARDGGVLPTTGSLSGLALAQGTLVISADIGLDGRLEPRVRNLLLDRNIHAAVVIPLLHQGKPLGSINLLYERRPELGEVDIDTFNAIGRTVSMALANARQFEILQYQTRRDGLTGLPNRVALHERFEAVAEAVLDGPANLIGLLLLDLDRFKDINDTLGHPAGDVLLRAVGTRLERIAAERDALLCRLGGDEFAVLATRLTTPAQLEAIAAEIVESLHAPFDVEQLRLEIGGSIGMALYPHDGGTSRELLRCADVAMYEAKRHGGGVRRYESALDRHTPQRLALLTEMGRAIRGKQLILHYQPKIDLATGAIAGFEALVRWRHPRFGLLMPGAFIPLVEVTEHIHALTRDVLRQALEQQRRWREAGHCWPVAVNLSARNLIDERCLKEIVDLLAKHDVPAGMLELEITETAFMHDPEGAARQLEALAALGVRLSIDDFGTGHSSLVYLRRLPLAALKIDREFVQGLTGHAPDRIILQSTIGLAHNLGLKVVAEGVEDEEIADALRGLHCDAAQGFHFCRPRPWSEIEHWLAEGMPADGSSR